MRVANVRPWGSAAVDLELTGAVISAVVPHIEPARPGDVDGRGRLALPSFSDVHVHLDSTRIGLPFRPHTGAPGVWGMMLNDRRSWRSAEVSLPERVAGTLERMITHGTTRVRSYARIDVDCRLEKLEAVLAAKRTHAGRCEVEVMAFPQAGLLLEDGTVAYLEEALKLGATVMGGIDRASSTATRCGTSTSCSGWPSGTASTWTSTCTNPDTWRCSPPS